MVRIQGDTTLSFGRAANPVSLIGCGLAFYAAIWLAVGIAFVATGAGRVLPGSASFTPGARLLILPGAAAPWPYVLIRWLITQTDESDQLDRVYEALVCIGPTRSSSPRRSAGARRRRSTSRWRSG
jgi:hypothetical protein